MTGISSQFSLEEKQPIFNFCNFKILTQLTPQENNSNPFLELIAGDASDRKFYRLKNNSNSNVICMQFPKWEGGYGGDPISWIGMHNALSAMGLPVPKILEIDETNACIWTEDLGDEFLNSKLTQPIFNLINSNCADTLNYYKNALDLLLEAQYSTVQCDHPALSRFFDYEKLHYEMNFFVTHFLNGLLNLNINENNQLYRGIYEDFNLLCKKLDGCDKVLCHRDYHVFNIMVKSEKLYWIDFQDARMGPHSYDVVSLLRDSYVDISWETRDYLFNYYFNKLNDIRQSLNLKIVSSLDFKLECLLMGLQRNIKALGSFGYLATVKSKPKYLQYVQHTLNILNSKNAQIHEETDLKILFPSIFKLIDDLVNGIYSKKLNKIISNLKLV